MPEYAHFKVCKPFSMRPDEVITKDILWMALDPIDDPTKHLCIPNVTEVDGKWQDALGTPILTPGQTYDITVEVLSANTRKFVLRIVALQKRGRWILKNAPGK
jgi:hypothetical protein